MQKNIFYATLKIALHEHEQSILNTNYLTHTVIQKIPESTAAANFFIRVDVLWSQRCSLDQAFLTTTLQDEN